MMSRDFSLMEVIVIGGMVVAATWYLSERISSLEVNLAELRGHMVTQDEHHDLEKRVSFIEGRQNTMP